MGRRRMFKSKATISFNVEEEDYKRFLEKCESYGLTVSDVLREFVKSFINAQVVEERRTLIFNIDLKVEQVIKEEKKPSKPVIEYIRSLELQEFKEKLAIWRQMVVKTRNSMDLYDIKKSVLQWLKKLKDVPEDVLNEAKSIVELCDKRLEQLRRL